MTIKLKNLIVENTKLREDMAKITQDLEHMMTFTALPMEGHKWFGKINILHKTARIRNISGRWTKDFTPMGIEFTGVEHWGFVDIPTGKLKTIEFILKKEIDRELYMRSCTR